MRNGPNNNKRLRNRSNNHSHSSNNNNHNRRSQNPMTRVYESNGPDIKIRGTASHVAEKYLQLARDARSSGDPVAAENYYQHAEHYFRLIAAAQEQFRQTQPQPRDGAGENTVTDDMGEDEGENFSHFGAEPGFGPNHQPNPQPQPQPRQEQPREQNQQPREQYQPRESRPPQPSFQQQPREPREQPPADVGAGLPSFITGSQSNAAPFEGNAAPAGQEPRGDRFPRRRRRPHAGPRPDVAPVPAGDDV
jgi:hypothetical protein